ncbi:hypothetical protein BGX34_001904 [Mortierella sp. NVP85]|nr:hypothetical protein BGX34_001904 [Mortierella sp. NVP85]
MATHQEVKVKKTKTMTLSIPTAGKGPNGEPLFFGAVDAPARIMGTVTFSSNYECKGNDIYIQYTAMAVAKWSRRSGKRTYYYEGRQPYDEKTIQLVLPHPKPGAVQAGEYSCPFDFPVDAQNMPSSFRGRYAWMSYKVKAVLVRNFPSTNVVREHEVWVLNTLLPRPEMPIPNAPMPMTRYSGNLKDMVDYICVIPSTMLFLTQQVPITFKVMPSAHQVQVISAVVKLKQYTQLVVRTASKTDKKELINIPLKDGWPVPEPNQSWQRTVVVPFPGAPQLTPTIQTPMITKIHILKLIMQVKLSPRNDKHEIRIEMPVAITAPRPPGEPYPAFDLNHHLSRLDRIH